MDVHELPEEITDTMKVISKKWAIQLLHTLETVSLSFTELQEELDGIATSVLADLLKELQEYHIIEKRVVSQSPKKTVYFITMFGEKLCQIITLLSEWGSEFTEVKSKTKVSKVEG